MRTGLIGVLCAAGLVSVHGSDLPQRFGSRAEAGLHLLGGEQAAGLRDTGPIPQAAPEGGRKSPALAAVYSLLVPGMGELYADGFSSGRYFLAAEGGLWLTYATFEIYGNALRDDARSFARSRAGVDPAGKSDQFYVDVGNFMNVREFNEKQLRDREPERLYDPLTSSWQWDTEASRAQYREQRVRSETMFNNRKFVVAAVVINHVASAINAARSAVSYNRALAARPGDVGFHASVLGTPDSPHGLLLTVTRAF
ncbi:MAG: hypothetical protein WB626_00610 [Bacteroidota bacterium]